jgi:hypothetical protein
MRERSIPLPPQEIFVFSRTRSRLAHPLPALLSVVLASAGAVRAMVGEGGLVQAAHAPESPRPLLAEAWLPPGWVGPLAPGRTSNLVPEKRVRGRLIKASANLQGADLARADLSRCTLTGADLRGADLSGCNLAWADLSGADLTRANLTGANLAEANLAGARMFMAQLEGSTGADLNRVEPHPFFEPEPGEAPGALRFVAVDSDSPGLEERPCNLLAGPLGNLFWLCKNSPSYWRFAANGQTFGTRPHQNRTLLGLIVDSRDRLWHFGDRNQGFIPLAQMAQPVPGSSEGSRSLFDTATFTTRPNLLAAAENGEVWVSLPGTVHRCSYEGGFGDFLLSQTAWVPQPTDRVLPTRQGDGVIVFGPERTDITLVKLAPERVTKIPLKPGCRVQGLVQAADHRIWFTQSGLDAIGALDPATGKLVHFPMAQPEGQSAPPTGFECAAPERLDATARLAALGVNLTPGMIRHILAGHGFDRDPTRSQFAPRHSSQEGIAELLARGFEEAGTVGALRASDRDGRFLTFCDLPAVGHTLRGGAWIPARRFLVVTSRHRVEGAWEHDVVTAYPVP